MTGIADDIGEVTAHLILFGVLIGFLVCLAGMILLLIRHTVAVGRLISLIGLGFYYLAAIGDVLCYSLYITEQRITPQDIVISTLITAVVVGLPAFFMTRTLIRAQKAESIES